MTGQTANKALWRRDENMHDAHLHCSHNTVCNVVMIVGKEAWCRVYGVFFRSSLDLFSRGALVSHPNCYLRPSPLVSITNTAVAVITSVAPTFR